MSKSKEESNYEWLGEDDELTGEKDIIAKDIMGDELYGQSPLDGAAAQRRKKILRQQPQYQIARPYNYPSQMREVGE